MFDGEGPMVACTRQNAGSCAAATSDWQVGAMLVLGGGRIAVSGPAGCTCAESMRVSGRFSVVRSTQAMPCGAFGLSARAGEVKQMAQAAAAAAMVNALMISPEENRECRI